MAVTMAQCEQCGTQFEAKRKTARFCGNTCRTRAHRSGVGTKTTLAAAKRINANTEEAAAGAAVDFAISNGELTQRVVSELKAANSDETVYGMLAVFLAKKLEHSGGDTGSAFAALVRELKSTYAAATAGSTRADDPVDEVKERRDKKLERARAGS